VTLSNPFQRACVKSCQSYSSSFQPTCLRQLPYLSSFWCDVSDWFVAFLSVVFHVWHFTQNEGRGNPLSLWTKPLRWNLRSIKRIA